MAIHSKRILTLKKIVSLPYKINTLKCLPLSLGRSSKSGLLYHENPFKLILLNNKNNDVYLRGFPNVPVEPADISRLRLNVESSFISNADTIWIISRSFFISGGLNVRLANDP